MRSNFSNVRTEFVFAPFTQMEERSEWKNRWQVQLSELKRRSMNKNAHGNMSWGARMRRQRTDSSSTEL
ncbi:hypothetical protein CsSME_00045533 [Camellia sinensis var. sinensis]